MGTTRHNLPGVTEIFSEYVRQRRNNRTQEQVMAFLDPLLARLRADVATMGDDRYLAPDLAAAAHLIGSGALAQAAGVALPALS